MTNLQTAESLLLLLTTPDGAVVGLNTERHLAVAAGAVVDLVHAGAVELTADRKPRFRIAPGTAVDGAAGRVLALLAAKDGKALEPTLSGLSTKIERVVAEALVEEGVVGRESAMLGLRTRYPVRDAARVQALRARLVEVVAGAQPGVVEVPVLGIAQGIGSLKDVVEADAVGMTKRELAARVEQVVAEDATSGAASDAARKAVQAASMAVAAAVAASTAASLSS